MAQKATVLLISGKDRETLEPWVKNDSVNLIAEHWLWIKKNDQDKDCMPLMKIDNNWKTNILKVMDYYVLRTPGTFVGDKNSSLIRHYRQAESGLGDLYSKFFKVGMKLA